MSLESNGKSGSELSSIKEDIQANADSIENADDLAALRERVDAVELLAEQFGRAQKLQDDIADYAADLRAELNDLRNFRWWITTFSACMSIFLFVVFMFCILWNPEWFVMLDQTLKVSVLAGLGAGSVFLMSILLKGVYRSRQERNHDELLPEPLRALIDMYKS